MFAVVVVVVVIAMVTLPLFVSNCVYEIYAFDLIRSNQRYNHLVEVEEETLR